MAGVLCATDEIEDDSHRGDEQAAEDSAWQRVCESANGIDGLASAAAVPVATACAMP